MTKNKSTVIEVVAIIVEALKPLESVERHRVIQAALLLLGETQIPTGQTKNEGKPHAGQRYFNEVDKKEGEGLSRQALTWMKQYHISSEQLEQIFDIEEEGSEVISAEMPGKNKSSQTINAYVLQGINAMLKSGESNFDDKSARDLCTKAGCYDYTNHSKYLATKGNLFTGTKEKGWKLTSPGLKHGAQLINELAKV